MLRCGLVTDVLARRLGDGRSFVYRVTPLKVQNSSLTPQYDSGDFRLLAMAEAEDREEDERPEDGRRRYDEEDEPHRPDTERTVLVAYLPL